MDIIELLNKLDDLSAWRKKELSQAYFLAENARNKDSRRYLCRVWVLMMYAHCDNFLKEATRVYLEYISANLTNVTHYKFELMWLVLRGKENIIHGNESNYKSLDDYFTCNKNIFFEEILIKKILTMGSFKYKLLRYFCDWVMQIKYDHNKLRDFCEKLKTKRDSIAHGEESYIEHIGDCLPWHKKTINFIDSLKECLIESVR